MQELYIDSVNHRYGDQEILSSVYLSCKVGEVIGLLGRNGSGKSTLLKIIFGSIQPKFKHLKVDGEFKLKGYLTHQISYLPQGYFIPHYLKIKDLIDLYINQYKEQILQLDVYKSNLNEPIGNLSGGNRRLVEALLIVYSDAKYVLLDEPFSQLAPLLAHELKEHISKLKHQKGFIITDHYYRQIMEVSSRIMLLHNGCNYTINNEDDLQLYNYLPK
ncbi:MAG: ATP-binding cassette domain-containing protein [Pedobacter sp.]|jgi:ABC-type multidrug transport system ATPase subunit|uniref:ATP-binding cassette domain-containing protein n=1 Tax=Pedobacter sp. TaxID=1411316 RepID=UPI0035653B88